MKMRWKQAAVLTAAGLCFWSLALPTAAADAYDETVHLYDEGDVLSETEFDQVFDKLCKTAEQIDMQIGVWIGSTELGSGSEEATQLACADQYEAWFERESDGVLLYIDMSGTADLYDFMLTSGMGIFYYTNSAEYNRVGEIITDVEDFLPRGGEDIPAAIQVFCTDLKYYQEAGVPSDTYYAYNPDADSKPYTILEDGVVKRVDELPVGYEYGLTFGEILLASAIIGLVIGLIVGGISLLVICARYRFRTAASLQNYIKTGDIHYRRKTDRFLRTYTTRMRINTGNGGGGGGGGGGHSFSSSSGGSYGGGGGHR